MATKASIFNGCLGILGEDAIIDPDTDTSPHAITLRSVYDLYRDSLLGMAYWPFARRWIVLSPDPRPPLSAFTVQFKLPANYISLVQREVYGVATGDRITKFDLLGGDDGRYLECDFAGPIRLRIIQVVTNPAYFDALFADALAAYLAHKTARRIVGNDESRINGARNEFEAIFPEAKRKANRDLPPPEPDERDVAAESRL